MKKLLLRDGGPRGRRCCFGRPHAPAAPAARSRAPTDGTIPGVLHVHTNRSDGLSGPDEIAAAAARAGLKFVVFTDHGDATRAAGSAGVPLGRAVPRRRRDQHDRRTLRRDRHAGRRRIRSAANRATSSKTSAGSADSASRRIPDSPKAELRWSDWSVPFDGIEIVNLDTSWRQWAQQANAPADPASGSSQRWPARRRLLAALAAYPFRPAETIGSLVQTGGRCAAMGRACRRRAGRHAGGRRRARTARAARRSG